MNHVRLPEVTEEKVEIDERLVTALGVNRHREEL